MRMIDDDDDDDRLYFHSFIPLEIEVGSQQVAVLLDSRLHETA